MNWLLDPSVSTFGPDIDRLYYIILFITGVVFVLTEGLLIYFLIRYRRQPGRRAEYIHGSTRAEVIWTVVPFVIVVALGLMSKPVWDRAKEPSLFPEGAYELRVVSRQFEWEAHYPGANGNHDAPDAFSVLNRVHVPVNEPVIIHLESEDVIHSFFVPRFRVKQDALPGRSVPVWFEITEEGEYQLACAELCGIGHYRMDGVVVVQSRAEFDAWRTERQIAALNAAGAVVAGRAGPEVGEAGRGEAEGGL
jgi:cytochrome c oxidase subunit II